MEKTVETKPLGIGDDSGLSGRGVEMTVETCLRGNGDDSGDLAARDWRRERRLSSWGLEMTLEA